MTERVVRLVGSGRPVPVVYDSEGWAVRVDGRLLVVHVYPAPPRPSPECTERSWGWAHVRPYCHCPRRGR